MELSNIINSDELEFSPNTGEIKQQQFKPRNYKSVLIMVDDIIAETKTGILIGNLLDKGYNFWINKKSVFKNDYYMPWALNVSIDQDWDFTLQSDNKELPPKTVKGSQLMAVFDRWIDKYANLLGDNEKLAAYKINYGSDIQKMLYLERMPLLIYKYNKLRKG